MNTKNQDIPLKLAMVAWNCTRFGDGRIKVIAHPDEADLCAQYQLQNTTGACYLRWHEMSDDARFRHLLLIAWKLVTKEGLQSDIVDDALSVIPEWREMRDNPDW